VDQGEVSIEYKPTEKMYFDVLTKPKQGKAFRKDRAELMNCPEDNNDDEEKRRTHPSLLEKTQAVDDVLQVRSALIDIPPNSTQPRRSVLEKTSNRKVGAPTDHETRWTRHNNRVSTYDKKARIRHSEAVKARILRARERNLVRGRE
jgi:hypothetical protein